MTTKAQKIPEAEEELISHLAGAIFTGGADTVRQLSWFCAYRSHSILFLLQIASTLAIFILAMILHPQAQFKAQQELDSVIGPDRLPSFEDRNNLPYVRAICKEVLRWHPIAPSAVPHGLIQDDIVGQYFIPAGTLVVGNAWSVVPLPPNH